MRDIRRSRRGIEEYKRGIGRCCSPDCETPLIGLETHHIRPVGQDGLSECENYIVLCRNCHKEGTLHSKWYEWQETLYQWKFYNEIMIIGYTSDEYTHREYLIHLRAAYKAKHRAKGVE